MSLVYLAWGSYFDFKDLELPHWFSYSLLLIGFYLDWKGALGMLGLGTFLFMVNFWGAADSRILGFIGGILGYNVSLIHFLAYFAAVAFLIMALAQVHDLIKNKKLGIVPKLKIPAVPIMLTTYFLVSIL